MREENQWRRGNNTTKAVTVIRPVETQAQEYMYIQGDDKDVIRIHKMFSSRDFQEYAEERWMGGTTLQECPKHVRTIYFRCIVLKCLPVKQLNLSKLL